MRKQYIHPSTDLIVLQDVCTFTSYSVIATAQSQQVQMSKLTSEKSMTTAPPRKVTKKAVIMMTQATGEATK